MTADLAAGLRALLTAFDSEAETLEAFGASGQAQAARETARRALEVLTAWWNEPLAIDHAASWGGYSPSQLRRLIREGKIPEAPIGGIRRRDVPVHPGHKLPLGLEPATVADRDFVSQVVQHRHIGRAS
ncbi:MAG: hypothetical protein H0W29_12810 [Gemmatimonadales bacterium]|nr:hypothetical protein [Gemmatimonadales bacterium]